MKKIKPTKRMVMVLFAMLLLWLAACKRNELQPPMPSVLNSYRGTDKMVLQVIETLKEPVNKALLAELEKQGSINWEYKALITSRFLDGVTLRFATGSNGNYLDAEVNAKTRALKLYSKQMQEQRDAMVKKRFNDQLSKQDGRTLRTNCKYLVTFEYEVDSSSRGLIVLAEFLFELFIKIIKDAGLTIVNVEGWRVTFSGSDETTTTSMADFIQRELMEIARRVVPEGLVLKTMDVTGSCDDGPVFIQNIPPITWESQTFPVVNEYKDSETTWMALYPDCEVFFDGKEQAYKLKINAVYGRVETIIRTGGSRDPLVTPPRTQDEAIDAINSMKNYLTQKRGTWHTVEATKAHEAYHYSEYKAFAGYYWPLVGHCINRIKVPSSGNFLNDKALITSRLIQVLSIIDNISKAYLAYMRSNLDLPGGMAYQVGQAKLNEAIVQIQQLAARNGWRVPQGITPVFSSLSVPPFQPLTSFNCPIF